MRTVREMLRNGAVCCVVVSSSVPVWAGDTKAISLENGSGDTGYVRVARSASLEPQQFTIDVIFRPDGPGLGNTQNVNGSYLVAKPREGASGVFIFSWYLGWSEATNRVVSSVSNNGGSIGATLESNSLVFTGQTVRATFTFDGQTMRLYLNGCLDAEFVTPFADVYYGNNDVLIGAANFCCGFLRRFDGSIDELSIWSEALNAEQIADLNPAGGGDSLAAWWSFDGDSLADLSGNGNDGIAIGSVSFASPPSFSCANDLNGDGSIDLDDLNIVLTQFGQSSCLDATGDKQIDLDDLNAVLVAFGSDCP